MQQYIVIDSAIAEWRLRLPACVQATRTEDTLSINCVIANIFVHVQSIIFPLVKNLSMTRVLSYILCNWRKFLKFCFHKLRRPI